MKKYILFDHDGVLVDTEFWYYRAGERALAEIGLSLDQDQYLRDMSQGASTWAPARAAGVDERTITRQRQVRDAYYQEYLRTEAIEIEGVVDTLAELAKYARMAIVTTARRADFDLIHERRQIRRHMDFVLVREDYKLAKPHPEPYLTGFRRLGATTEERWSWRIRPEVSTRPWQPVSTAPSSITNSRDHMTFRRPPTEFRA